MKKKISLILVAIMIAVLALTACNKGKTEEPTQAATEKQSEKQTEKPTEKPTETPTEKPTEPPTEATAAEDPHETAAHPASDGWYVDSGLAVKMDAFYFNTDNMEILLQGVVESEGADGVDPIAMLKVTFYQDGQALQEAVDGEMPVPVNPENGMQIQKVFIRISPSSDVTVTVEFPSGNIGSWAYDLGTYKFYRK